MAEKPKHEHEAHSREHHTGGKKKKHLHQVITTQAHDGSWSHEHVYKDHLHSPHAHPPVFAGTSQTLEDMHQHNEDHWGPQENPDAGGEGPAAGSGEAAAEAETGEAAEG